MGVLRELRISDADLLRALAGARAEVDALGTGDGRLERLVALEDEVDRRVESRRRRSADSLARLPTAL